MSIVHSYLWGVHKEDPTEAKFLNSSVQNIEQEEEEIHSVHGDT